MWLGGARVSTSAMHLVVVAPAERKRGVGRALVAGALRELHAAGTALCVLYPATEGLYRHAGFHDAGVCVRYRVAAENLANLDGDVRVERAGRAELASLREAYRERARATTGNLDRNPWMWTRVLDPGGAVAQCVRAVDADGRVVAYAVAQRVGPDLNLRDLVALAPEAERAVLRHLASWGPRFIEWNGPPIAPSPGIERVRERVWFARVCNLESAFASLRTPPDVSTSLELDVRDDVIADNAGRWTITIAGGVVSARRGGGGSVRVDIGELAPLVTGHTTLGPWMSDVF
jgi:predicted acetyltransferase